MSDEVVEYLKKPGNLEAALELQKVVQDVREKAFEVFWQNVEVELRRVASPDLNGWAVRRKEPTKSQGGRLGFVPQGDTEMKKWSLVFGDLRGQEDENFGPYFGVWRGSAASEPHKPLIEKVQQSLRKLGIDVQADDYWAAYAYMRDIGIPILGLTDNVSVIRVNKDNDEQDHPLARQAAELLWKAFVTCRHDLEALNYSSA